MECELKFPLEALPGEGAARRRLETFRRRARALGLSVEADAALGGNLTLSGPRGKLLQLVSSEVDPETAEWLAESVEVVRRPESRARRLSHLLACREVLEIVRPAMAGAKRLK